MHLKVSSSSFHEGSDFPSGEREMVALFNELKGEQVVFVVNFGLQIILKHLVFYLIQKHVKYKNVSVENAADFRNHSLMWLPGRFLPVGPPYKGPLRS